MVQWQIGTRRMKFSRRHMVGEGGGVVRGVPAGRDPSLG